MCEYATYATLMLICQRHASHVTVRDAMVLLSLLERCFATQSSVVLWYHFPTGTSAFTGRKGPQMTMTPPMAMTPSRRAIAIPVPQAQGVVRSVRNIFRRDVATIQWYVSATSAPIFRASLLYLHQSHTNRTIFRSLHRRMTLPRVPSAVILSKINHLVSQTTSSNPMSPAVMPMRARSTQRKSWATTTIQSTSIWIERISKKLKKEKRRKQPICAQL